MMSYELTTLLIESERLQVLAERELKRREARIVERALEIARGTTRRPAPEAPLYGGLFGAGELVAGLPKC